jgi:hypothetical protein
MLAKLVILEAAEADIDETLAWYEQRQTGLGFEFMRAVDAHNSRDPAKWRARLP